MKPEFLENYRNQHEDTLDACTYDFDWADLERRLGEAEEQLEDRDFAALGLALQSIIEWIIEGGTSPSSTRTLMLAGVPSPFSGP